MAQLQIFYNELQQIIQAGATIPPGSAATINGPTHDLSQFVGDNSPYWFRCGVLADEVGTLNVEHSLDGTTWFVDDGASSANVANKWHILQSNICVRYVRLQFVNGATACTTFLVSAALVG